MSMQRTKYFSSQNMAMYHPSYAEMEDMRGKTSVRTGTMLNESGDEMMTLHKKLQMETENIIRWKASADVNTKQLEVQLDETRGTVTDLRRNLMELQLTNENLSQNLIKEREERRLVDAKVLHTRELLSSLQLQCQDLEGSVGVLHQEKDYHCAVQADTIGRMEILAKNFRDLSTLSEEKLKVIAEKAREDITSLENKKASLEELLSMKSAENAQLQKICCEQKQELDKLSDELKTASLSAEERGIQCKQLSGKLHEVEDTLSKTLKDLENQVSEHSLTKELLKEEKLKLEESKSEFCEAVDKLRFLKNENDTLEGTNGELMEKLDAISNLKLEVEKELSQKCQINKKLEVELGNLQIEISQSDATIVNLNTELCQKEENCQKLHEENANLSNQFDICRMELSKAHSQIQELEGKLTVLTQSFEDCERTISVLKQEQMNLNEEKSKLQEELQQKVSEIQEKDDRICELLKKNCEAKEIGVRADETIVSLQNQLADLREKNKELNTLIEENKLKFSEFTSAEEIMKNSIESLENKREEERLRFENEKNSMQTTLAEKETSLHALKEELESKIAELDEQLDKAKGELNEQAHSTKKEMDEISSKAASEESRIKEEMEALEVKMKKMGKDLEKLQAKNESQAEDLKTMKARVKEQEKDIKSKNKKISEEEKKIEKLEKSVGCLEESVTNQENINMELEEECQKLKKDLENSKEAQATNRDTIESEKKVVETELEKARHEVEHLEIELKEKKDELVAFQNSTNDMMLKMNADMQTLISDHKIQMDALEAEREKLKEEKHEIQQEAARKLNVMEFDTDDKIKKMADMLARYKSEYETKLADAEQQIRQFTADTAGRKSQEGTPSKAQRFSSITERSPAKCSSLPSSQSSVITRESPVLSQSKEGRTRAMKRAPKSSSAHTEVQNESISLFDELGNDSFVFKQPEVPSISPHNAAKHKFNKEMKEGSGGILKNKRTLLPSGVNKHVMFKLPPSSLNSGDSSSDACTFEVIDSDDVFDEVRVGSSRSILKPKSVVRPQANVTPMRHYDASSKEENTSPSAYSDHLLPHHVTTGTCKTNPKFFKEKKRKKEMKTYSLKKFGRESYTPPKM